MKKIILALIALAYALAVTQCSRSAKDNEDTPATAEEQPADIELYLERGRQHAMATQAVLGKNLAHAIQTQGTDGALAFCNLKAYPLTDSMATSLGVEIKRVSDKNRNPGNAANEEELHYITTAKEQLSQGEEAKPEVHQADGQLKGYYPILTNQMCLQCHGKPNEDITSATMAKIRELYPADKATGYNENELRGIWVVTMDKQAQ